MQGEVLRVKAISRDLIFLGKLVDGAKKKKKKE